MTSTRKIEKELRKAEPSAKGDDAIITLGRNSNGTLEQVELGKIKHLLVGGLSGAGKTCLFQHIIEDLTSQGVEVYCVDAKRVGYLNFKGREHFHLFTSMERSLHCYKHSSTNRRCVISKWKPITPTNATQGVSSYLLTRGLRSLKIVQQMRKIKFVAYSRLDASVVSM